MAVARRSRQMRYRTLAEPLEAQAQCTPDVVALVGDDGTLTYRELNEGANQLARALRENGVKRGDFVGICIERSMSAVIAILGVAKAGAAYVPLDPELPVGRMGRILAHTSPVLVLVHPATKTGLPEGGWRIVSVEPAHHRYSLPYFIEPACDCPLDLGISWAAKDGGVTRGPGASIPVVAHECVPLGRRRCDSTQVAVWLRRFDIRVILGSVLWRHFRRCGSRGSS